MGYAVFKDESIIARAKQVLGVENDLDTNMRKNFLSRIAKYHPDKSGPFHKERAGVLIEAYHVLTGRVKPLDSKLLENDELVASLLPEGVKPVKLGTKYDDWLKDRFYNFVRP